MPRHERNDDCGVEGNSASGNDGIVPVGDKGRVHVGNGNGNSAVNDENEWEKCRE